MTLWRGLRCAALFTAAFAVTARADVRVALQPGTVTIAPGDTITITLEVPVAGTPFNGFDATIGYDRAALTFLPASPLSLQEGPAMRGACGNTFHLFKSVADSLTITDVLLCANQSLTGPGTLYALRFRASANPQATVVRLRAIQFYDGGVNVGPAIPSDATIAIGVTLAAPPTPGEPGGRLRVLDNPARGGARFAITTPTGPWNLALFDTAGRRVRRLQADTAGGGARTLVWDGCDDAGRPLPPGDYRAVLDFTGGRVSAPFVQLP